MPTVLYHTRDMRITNLDALPAGTGCPYLVVIESHRMSEYVARRWLRKMPSALKRGELLIRFA